LTAHPGRHHLSGELVEGAGRHRRTPVFYRDEDVRALPAAEAD
jgi:hypothetical protein